MSGDSAAIPADDVVFALFDGDFHLGLGALVNSLYASGFRGAIYAAYRGSLPPWATGISRKDGYGQFHVAEGCVIRFISVDYRGHLTNYKPTFILSTAGRHCHAAKRFFYFDVDVTVKAPWPFFRNWVECGVALVQDIVEPRMPANHPLRRTWREFAGRAGYQCRDIEGYFNGGFVGLERGNLEFVAVWQSLIERLKAEGLSLENFHFRDRTNPFTAMDQDMMNVAVMATDFAISPVENPGMDFSPGGYVMSHAAFETKPWQGRYIRDALRGFPPNTATKLYWRHVTKPIWVMPAYRLGMAKVVLALTGAIGRFYRRR